MMSESNPEDLLISDSEIDFNINHDWCTFFQAADTSQFTSLSEYVSDNDSKQMKQEVVGEACTFRSVNISILQDDCISTGGTEIPTQQPTIRLANQDWAGYYNFSISFAKEGKLTNATDWTYSASITKLYVNMDASCPIQFHTAKVPPSGSIIRAVPAFSKPKHTAEVVKRCLLHRDPKDPSNINHLEIVDHLIRCEDAQAKYHCDPLALRTSVTVPYYRPAEGMDYIYYVYKFMCFCSCMGGGICKRPLQIIFTLECKDKVIGRKALDIRICASPGRDRKTEECKDAKLKKSLPVKRSRGADKGHCSKTDPAKKLKSSTEDITTKKSKGVDDIYTLQIKGKKNYKTLKYLNELMQFRDVAKNAREDEESD